MDINNSNSIYGIILQDLLIKIDMFEEYSFSKFKFPNNISDKAVIGILFRVDNKESKIETKKVLKYFNFMNYNIKDNKKKNYSIDIPFYNPNVPEGFSIFCTKYEENIAKEYMRKNQNKKEKSIEEDLNEEIQPSRKHFYCQLCKCHFNSYKTHCSSASHFAKINERSNQYLSIKNSLNRINNYWKNEKETKDKNKEEKEKKDKRENNEKYSKNNNLLNNLLFEQSTDDTLIGNPDLTSKNNFNESFLSFNKGVSSFDSLKKQSLLFKAKKRNYQEYLKNSISNNNNDNNRNCLTKRKRPIINPNIFMELIMREKEKLLKMK